jgi:hypothetical protein
MTFDLVYIFQGFIVLFLFSCLYVARKYTIELNQRDKIKNFESYMAVLQYHMEKAYDIILKDRLLIYSIEGMKVDDKEFNTAASDFVRLTQKLLGPSLSTDFISFYGGEDTFAFNLVEYFNTRYENDEIRESAQRNLMESEAGEDNKNEQLRSVL